MSFTSIDDNLDKDFAEAWRPEPGDKLVGEVVGIGERTGSFGSYPIITIRQDDGVELAFHAFHTVAATELAKQHPRLGERIGIKYRGIITTDKSRYHGYRVQVERPGGGTFDWGKYGSTDEPPLEPAGDAKDGEWRNGEPAGDDPLPY